MKPNNVSLQVANKGSASLATALLALIDKERQVILGSAQAFLFLIGFLTILLFGFFWGAGWFARNVADMRPMFESLPILLIFLSSAMTMKAWSEERARATLDFLCALPVPLWVWVLGKFLAYWQWVFLALLLTLPLPLSLHFAVTPLDWGPILGGYVATLALGALYVSIGLWVSARTDNPMSALILSVALCALLYLIGSPWITDHVNSAVAEWLRAWGVGARFHAIARGVLDISDLAFYGLLTMVFGVLTWHGLNRDGWANAPAKRTAHRGRWALCLLILANLGVSYFWLAPWNLRLDLTADQRFSLSPLTQKTLHQLPAPILIRGYFSRKTHPLLAPLQSQLRDWVTEMALLNPNKIQWEFIDPTTSEALEEEANSRFGIRPLPFRVHDRYQASVVSGYFNILVQMGDHARVLGVRELLDIKTPVGASPIVVLKNPEYDLMQAIRKVSAEFGAFSAADQASVAMIAPQVMVGEDDIAQANQSATLSFSQLQSALESLFETERITHPRELANKQYRALLMIAPQRLDSDGVAAIERFLQSGKSVIVIASPFRPMMTATSLGMQTAPSGLEAWLANYGLHLGQGMVLDPHSAVFPTMTTRELKNGYAVPTMLMAPYPYFVIADSASNDLAHHLHAGLSQVVLPWAVPIDLQKPPQGTLIPILSSSDQSWVSDHLDVVPVVNERGESGFTPPPSPPSAHTLAAIWQGTGDSPARLILIAANAFASDAQINLQSVVEGQAVRTPIQYVQNLLDYSLGREEWLMLRARSWFGAFLPPLTDRQKTWIETANYGFALVGVLMVLIFARWRNGYRLRQYQIFGNTH